jgi:NADPH:quinone reductase-like Zn-dependent oxidoreductase
VKALLRSGYGGAEVLRVADVPAPVPAAGEVLIRVKAASLNAMDAHFLAGRPAFARLFTGLGRPKDPRAGSDLAGEVVAVGPNVVDFAVGEEVFGVARGALAELACAREEKIARKPPALTFVQAASLPVAGTTALQGLRDAGRLEPGQRVLVLGAGGGVGGFAVQIAAALGARVTAATAPEHLERLRALGCGPALDHSRDDLAAGGAPYDLIFDLGGVRRFSALRRLLAPEGRVVAAGIGGMREPTPRAMARWAGRVAAARFASLFGRQKLVFTLARLRRDDLAALAAMVEAGALVPPVTEQFALVDAGNAYRAVLGGQAAGKLVILP